MTTRPIHASQLREAVLRSERDRKFTLPRLPQTLVDRGQLLDTLTASIDVPLTLVTAPAGYGKSTTVAQWAEQSSRPVSWISLGREDNNPSRFFNSLLAVVAPADPDALVAVPDGSDTGWNLDETVETIVGVMSLATRHFFVVFDDFHIITNPNILETFSYLIKHIPSQAHFIITSRTAPNLQLGRLRANGELHEIVSADLGFSSEESFEFRETSGLGEINDELWEDLSSKTEGWIAGLQLARLSLAGMDRADTERYIQNFDGRLQVIDDYLLEEVIAQLPEELREFLVKTSSLPFLTHELCDYALRIDQSSQLMRDLLRRNLFVIAVDDDADWLRLHHLFADALKRRFDEEVDLGEIVAIRSRAAEWLSDHGYGEEAMYHAIASERWDIAANVAKKISESLETWDQALSMRYWLDMLPRDVVMADPELRYKFLWSLAITASHPETVEALSLINAENEEPSQRVWNNLVQMRISYSIGDVDGAYHQSREVLQLVTDDKLLEKMYSYIYIATSRYLVGEFEEAEEAFSEVRRLVELGGEPWMRNRGEIRYVDSLCLRGLLDDAVTLLGHLQNNLKVAIHAADTQVYWFLAQIHLERNELDQAEEALEKALEIMESREESWLSPELTTLAMIEWARGNIETAHEHAERARQVARAAGHPNFAQRAEAFQAMMWIATDQHILAERWLSTAQLDLRWAREFNQPYPALTHVRLRAARDELDDALTLLKEIIDETRRRRRSGDLVRLYAMQAGLLSRMDQTDAAAESLATAIDFGAPGGFVRSFLDEGTAISGLFNHPIIRDHTHRNYAQLIKRSFESKSPGLALAHKKTFEALSLREIDVLRLVADGKSNRSIAAELYISEPTVKKHISNILGKMDVMNRTQAVSVGREIGLL